MEPCAQTRSLDFSLCRSKKGKRVEWRVCELKRKQRNKDVFRASHLCVIVTVSFPARTYYLATPKVEVCERLPVLTAHSWHILSHMTSRARGGGWRLTKGIGFPPQMRGPDAKERSAPGIELRARTRKYACGIARGYGGWSARSGVDVLPAAMRRHPPHILLLD